MKYLITLITLTLISILTNGQTGVIKASGQWNNPAIWDNNQPNGPLENVYIMPGVEVHIPAHLLVEIDTLFNHGNIFIGNHAEMFCNQITHMGDTIFVADGGQITQHQSGIVNLIEGQVIFERKITKKMFNIFSSPIDSAEIKQVSGGFYECYNYVFDALNNAWAHDYLPTETIQCENNTYSPWLPFREADGIMNTGLGYFLYPEKSTLFFSDSSLHNDTINTFVYANIYDSSAYTTWNLVGNPYPSKIRMDEFLRDNQNAHSGIAYTMKNENIDRVFNMLAAIPYSHYSQSLEMSINPTDAFYLSTSRNKLQGADSAAIRFTNQHREPVQETGDFGQNTNAVVNVILKNKYNQVSSTTAIGYIDGETSNQFNQLYDAPLIENPLFYITSVLNSEKLHIQGIDKPDSTGTYIPLHNQFYAWYTGQISIERTNAFTEQVFLIDHLTNDTTSLETMYETRIDPADSNRFALWIIPSITISTSSNQISKSTSNQTTWFTANNVLHLSNASFPISQVRIYNVNGQEIYAHNIKNNRITIPLNSLSPGVYIGHATVNQQPITFKFIR